MDQTKLTEANQSLLDISRTLDSGFDVADRIAYSLDIETEGPAIRLPITAMGKGAKFGETIMDSERLFASQREPVGVRVVKDVALDIWDTGFDIVDTNPEEKSRDNELNSKVHAVLAELNFKQVFIRSTIFERRYGYGIIVLQYDDEASKLEDPLPDVGGDGKGRSNLKISMMEPYPKTKIKEVVLVKQTDVTAGLEPVELIGYPRFYFVDRGDGSGTGTKIHHSRVILDSVRLDESKWEGVSVIDAIYDDLTVFRNMRWGMGQTVFRVGGGFPVITLKGAKEKQIQRYHESGKYRDICARTYMVKNDQEEIEFVGAQGVALNPKPYYDASLENLSMGSRIPKAVLRGAQAGAVVGSEVNLREYAQYISAEQSLKETVLRQLITRLLETGQIESEVKTYETQFLSPFELDDFTKARVLSLLCVALRNMENFATVDEIRARMDPPLDPLGGVYGNMIVGVQKILQAAFKNNPKNGGENGGDANAEAPNFEEEQLTNEYENIRALVNMGKLDEKGAMEKALEVTTKYVDKIWGAALRRIEDISGEQIGEQSPEAQTLRKEQINSYMDYFKKILTDILRVKNEQDQKQKNSSTPKK